MSHRDDLPAGEPPASPTEDRLGQFLDEAMEKRDRNETINVEEMLPDRPDLIERARELIADLITFGQAIAAPKNSGGVVPPALASPTPAAGVGVTFPNPSPGDFQVLERLGEGAFGEVWLARDLNLDRIVALKTLRFHRGTTPPPAEVETLRKEAQLLDKVDHPNVVRVRQWLSPRAGFPQEHYLVLGYVAGGSLGDRLKNEGPFDWRLAVRYAADVGEGLLAVHACGVLHRDIKPDNILWDRDRDEAVLTDFGVSARLGNVRRAGTPLYMAPEAFWGRAIQASDVYSLSASLFCLVTGLPPFLADTWQEVERLARGGLPEDDPRFAGIPEAVEQIIRSGLAPDQARRPPLPQFVQMLRGAFNQSLADGLAPPAAGAGPAPVDLRLVVRRQVAPETWQAVATTRPQPAPVRRDITKVPRQPGKVRVRTGEPIRIEVLSDRDGFVTVFNVGPSGNLHLLFPDDLPVPGASPHIQASQPLHVLDVQLEPPAGRERLFAVWSRRPLPLSHQQLKSLAQGRGLPGSKAYHASRDLVRVGQAVRQASVDGCHVVVLELEHGTSV
jgi:serine/threonine protein kinase